MRIVQGVSLVFLDGGRKLPVRWTLSPQADERYSAVFRNRGLQLGRARAVPSVKRMPRERVTRLPPLKALGGFGPHQRIHAVASS